MWFCFPHPRCINSMMGRITEAMINLRKRVDVVDVLILENNNIPHLPSRAFGSVAVNRLFIEHNGIARLGINSSELLSQFRDLSHFLYIELNLKLYDSNQKI